MRPRAGAGILAAGSLAALAVLYNFPPSESRFYPRCPFYAATHWLCPGCGGTRALYELLHLNLRGALHFNALLTALAPFALAWLVFSCYQMLRYDRFPALQIPRSLVFSLCMVALVFAVLRNAGVAFAI